MPAQSARPGTGRKSHLRDGRAVRGARRVTRLAAALALAAVCAAGARSQPALAPAGSTLPAAGPAAQAVGGWPSARPAPVPGAADPALSLDGLPRPAPPPAEAGPVVPAQVLRWRQEAQALEHGDGAVARDPVRAAQLYCRAARHGDAESQYALAWMLTNARGIERDDAQAAHLFAAAAEQGIVQAQNVLRTMGGFARGPQPACLRPPEPEPPAAAAAPAARTPVPVATAPNAAAGARSGFAGLPPPAPPKNAPPQIVRFVELVAPEYQLDAHLVLAVMATESSFDPLAVSPKNAQGLMQLMPGTAARFGVRRITDPVENIRGGMAYLRWLMAYFEGDVALALAAYNAGEGAVERWRGIPPYAETRIYVWKIISRINGQRTHRFDPKVTPPSDVLPLLRRGP